MKKVSKILKSTLAGVAAAGVAATTIAMTINNGQNQSGATAVLKKTDYEVTSGLEIKNLDVYLDEKGRTTIACSFKYTTPLCDDIEWTADNGLFIAPNNKGADDVVETSFLVNHNKQLVVEQNFIDHITSRKDWEFGFEWRIGVKINGSEEITQKTLQVRFVISQDETHMVTIKMEQYGGVNISELVNTYGSVTSISSELFNDLYNQTENYSNDLLAEELASAWHTTVDNFSIIRYYNTTLDGSPCVCVRVEGKNDYRSTAEFLVVAK